MIYCLIGRVGGQTIIAEETVSADSNQCWERAFWFLSRRQGGTWQARYWKRWDASRAWARRHGWRVTRCDLTPI